MIHIGFTGTQIGMTDPQLDTVRCILHGVNFTAHHGCCIGADAEFHGIVRSIPKPLVLHPSTSVRKTMPCDLDSRYTWRAPMPPLIRNRIIVRECDILLACPKDYTMQLRSGTWATVRYAADVNRRIVIVYPDGRLSLQGPWICG